MKRTRAILGTLATVLILAPIPAFAVTWTSNWTTGFTSSGVGSTTTNNSITAANTATDGTAFVDMGVFSNSGNTSGSLTATLSRTFTTSGSSGTVDFFVDYAFASALRRVSGSYTISFVPTSGSTVTLSGSGSAGSSSSTWTDSGILPATLQAGMSYTMTITITFATNENNGTRSWNNHDSPNSPFRFTFSGG